MAGKFAAFGAKAACGSGAGSPIEPFVVPASFRTDAGLYLPSAHSSE
jgi:hypothetical protein